MAQTPEGKLAVAMIESAILDQRREIKNLRRLPRWRRGARSTVEERLECIRDFFEEEKVIAINLAWCCHALFENGEEMRRYICKQWRAMRFEEGH
jgi:hypothetical protein